MSKLDFQRIIIGIDPGTNVMGYGLLGINGKEPQLIAMGVIKLNRMEDHYLRLRRIFFFGKNVQSMLKLGRAQGVAMAAALSRDVPITEYEPRKIKMAITGNGAASKEQVAAMLQRTLHIAPDQMPTFLDATDALAAALCHFYESSKPVASHSTQSWKAFIAQHPDRVK